MRGRPFQSRMNLLALAAMLLLALLPTLGRLAQAGQGDAGSAWTQMCTMAGLKVIKLPFAPAQPDAPMWPPPWIWEIITALLLTGVRKKGTRCLSFPLIFEKRTAFSAASKGFMNALPMR